ncbi:hypothetical protein EZS27_005089 [termite gut metagenome]|uniref:Uncharacterized protein n=1 Tax=termite gut metagenome TaxID=433724 RepID=A0A5J4SQN4_9ZZZZ
MLPLPVTENQLSLKAASEYGFYPKFVYADGKSDYAVPDYNTLCRRQKSLPVEIENRLESGEKTGLKVYGEGEWKVRKHGWSIMLSVFFNTVTTVSLLILSTRPISLTPLLLNVISIILSFIPCFRAFRAL